MLYVDIRHNNNRKTLVTTISQGRTTLCRMRFSKERDRNVLYQAISFYMVLATSQ